MYDDNTRKTIDNGGTVFFAQTITFDKDLIELEAGTHDCLSVVTTPVNALNRPITWKTSDSNIVSIDQTGGVEAKGVGKAEITALCDYGKAVCHVIVKKGKVSFRSSNCLDVILSDQNVSIPFVVKEKAGTLKISSDDPSVVDVTANGKLLIKGIGATIIHIRVAESQDYFPMHKTISVTVREGKFPAVQIKEQYNASTGVVLTWEECEGVAEYAIYRKEKNGLYQKIFTVQQGNGLSVLDNTVKEGKEYYYMVRGVSETKISPLIESEKGIIYLAKPQLYSIGSNSKGVLLEWAPVAGASGYRIFRSENNGKFILVKEEKEETCMHLYSEETSMHYGFFDTEIKEGIRHAYIVQAVKDNHVSAFSEKIEVVFITAPIVTAVRNGDEVVRIRWKKNLLANKYRVYKKNRVGTWKLLAELDDLVYTDRAVESINCYEYRVCAVLDNTEGAPREVTIWYIDKPELKSVEPHQNGLVVSWKAVNGAERYSVSRKTVESDWKRLGFVKSDADTKYLDSTIQKGVEYIYTVRAWYSNNDSECDVKGIKGKVD